MNDDIDLLAASSGLQGAGTDPAGTCHRTVLPISLSIVPN
jgi:hypothetical protein